jgi:hypothetical protein
MKTMKRNARTLTAILALVTGAATLTRGAPADDRNWATRVKCELQTAGGESLQTLTWQQGTTPLLSLDQYRSGKELSVTNAANTNVTAILFIGASATNASYAVVTNYAVVNNGFLFKVPTVGTNTQGNAAGWWYAVYFEQAGSRYWTGNGRVDIVKTTSTADGLAWSAIVPPVVITASDATNAARAVVGASGTVWRAEWVAGDTAEAALRASGDVKGTNYTDAVAAGKMNTNSAHSSLSGIEGAGTLHISASDTNKIATAWQNPASSTNWTWTSDGTQITLTGYSGPAAVVIPDTLDGLPVRIIGDYAFSGGTITSICDRVTITSVGEAAFINCIALATVDLPFATEIKSEAFSGCWALTSLALPQIMTLGHSACLECKSIVSVDFPAITSVGNYTFTGCTLLASVNIPRVKNVGISAFFLCASLGSINLDSSTNISNGAFSFCSNLVSVTFSGNAPSEDAQTYLNATSVTNYVTSSTATGWGATWNDRPVVRLPVTSDLFTGSGAGLTNVPIAGVTGLQGALDGKVPTNGMTDTIHGVRGGLNLHALADANGAGFYSADHYKAVTSMKGRTNVWDSAVPSTPAGIAAAGGVTTNSIPGPGCTYLGTSQAVTLTGATTSYRAEPAGVYTVSVAQAASRYTYALEVISTNPCTLAAGLNLQGSWTITGTNILCVVPCTGTLWRVYGRGL